MKNKQTVKMAAALIVLVAAIGIYFGMSMWNKSEEEQAVAESAETEILSISGEDVTAFSYVYNDETYKFVKEDGTWYYDSDRNFPVDQSTIEGKLSSAVSTTFSREIEISEDNLADYGLDSPVNTITITDSDGNETVFEIGDSNATTGEYYCRLNSGSTVYMISSTLNSTMSFELYSVADMEDFPSMNQDEVKEVTINDGSEVRSLDAEEDADVFSAVSNLTYEAHVDYDCDDLSQYGLDAPQYVITIGYLEETEETYDPADLTTYVLSVGNATEDGASYYVRLGSSREVNLISAADLESIITVQETEETDAASEETSADTTASEETVSEETSSTEDTAAAE